MWTDIAKPTGSNYTPVNPQGKQHYDQADLTYDDTNIFYDSVNETAWTGITKPSGYVNIIAGMATGLIGPPTYAFGFVSGDPWIEINKPT